MLYPLANGRDDKGKRAVMDAAGPAAIVAAMKQHVAIAELKCGGCDALGAVAYGDAPRGLGACTAGAAGGSPAERRWPMRALSGTLSRLSLRHRDRLSNQC